MDADVSAIQINLEDSKGTLFDIDFVSIERASDEVQSRNAYQILKNTNTRWKIGSEVQEFDVRSNINNISKHIRSFLDVCQNNGVQVMLIIPGVHQYGEKWEYMIADSQFKGMEPTLFNTIKNSLNIKGELI